MEMTINIDGVEKQIQFVNTESGYTITIDGRDHVVSDVSASQNRLMYLVDRRSFAAHLSQGPNALLLSIGGRNYRVEDEAIDDDGPGGHSHGGDGQIEAPMPGSIVAVHVAEGDSVVAGQRIVVVESMKMQNEITSPVAGVVTKVNCEPGQQVEFGALLVDIKAEE